MHTIYRPLGAGVFAAAVAATLQFAAPAEAAEVITLTQTGCQFVEPEGTDHGYKTSKKADCEKINAKNGKDRVAKSEVMKLKPGEYVFSCPLNTTPDYKVVVTEG
ncbi:MAG: hypothetical protein OXR84_14885 [Magnetovibrio sp.]|nr:hypothetical protein [Magnetovibrio sp.]